MLNKIASFFDSKLAVPMARIAEQKHLKAVRDGIIATLPIIIVSSMFLVIAFMPNQMNPDWALTQFIRANAGNILLPYRMAMFIMSLYAVFGIGHSLATSYKLDGLSGGILAELAFLLTIVPVTVPGVTAQISELANSNAELAQYIASMPGGFLIPAGKLGSSGMFVGIIVSIFAVEVYRFTQNSKFKITMPPQVPSSVARSFEALTPTLIVLMVVATITMWLKIDLHQIIGNLISPLISASDNIFSVLVIVFLTVFFWSFGIHGVSIVGTVARPLWVVLIDQNAAAYAAGEALPTTFAEPFYQWFIWIGGSGTTIGLGLLLFFAAKSRYAKVLGRTSIVPCIFNINEPLMFGAPVVLNPILIIPFIITPIVCTLLAYFATVLGLVSRVVAIAPWTLPGPIGAFFATGGDWRAAVLNIVLIVVSVVIYYPFFKIYDNGLVKQELENPEE